MKEAPDAGIPPALSNLLQVFVEISKDDVAVTINQRSREALKSDGNCHGSKGDLGSNLKNQAFAAGSMALFTAALKRDFWCAPLLRWRTPTLTALSILLKAALMLD